MQRRSVGDVSIVRVVHPRTQRVLRLPLGSSCLRLSNVSELIDLRGLQMSMMQGPGTSRLPQRSEEEAVGGVRGGPASAWEGDPTLWAAEGSWHGSSVGAICRYVVKLLKCFFDLAVVLLAI